MADSKAPPPATTRAASASGGHTPQAQLTHVNAGFLHFSLTLVVAVMEDGSEQRIADVVATNTDAPERLGYEAGHEYWFLFADADNNLAKGSALRFIARDFDWTDYTGIWQPSPAGRPEAFVKLPSTIRYSQPASPCQNVFEMVRDDGVTFRLAMQLTGNVLKTMSWFNNNSPTPGHPVPSPGDTTLLLRSDVEWDDSWYEYRYQQANA